MWLTTVVKISEIVEVQMNSEELGNLGFCTLLESYGRNQEQEDLAFATKIGESNSMIIEKSNHRILIIWKRK